MIQAGRASLAFAQKTTLTRWRGSFTSAAMIIMLEGKVKTIVINFIHDLLHHLQIHSSTDDERQVYV